MTPEPKMGPQAGFKVKDIYIQNLLENYNALVSDIKMNTSLAIADSKLLKLLPQVL